MIPGRDRTVSCSPECPDWFWEPPSLLCKALLDFISHGVKQPGCESDHSPSSNAEIQKEWSCAFGLLKMQVIS